MNKGKKLYEGKAKILYQGPEKGTAIQHFKDEATAFNNQKKSSVEGKGVLNNRISEHIFNNLNQIGIRTHLIKKLTSCLSRFPTYSTMDGYKIKEHDFFEISHELLVLNDRVD